LAVNINPDTIGSEKYNGGERDYNINNTTNNNTNRNNRKKNKHEGSRISLDTS
jgi:hypothetical protein